ncbi:MAG: hypothetical protein U0269_18490 [Polyangiales bacterium]
MPHRRRAHKALSIALLALSSVALVATSYRHVTPSSALPVAVTLVEGSADHRVHFVARYSQSIGTHRTPHVEVELQLSRASEPFAIRVEPRLTNASGDVEERVVSADTRMTVVGYANCNPECRAEYTVHVRRVGNDSSRRASLTVQALTRFSTTNWEPPAGTRVITTIAPYPGAP